MISRQFPTALCLTKNTKWQPLSFYSLQQRGATSVEYALFSGLIALVMLGAVTTTGIAVFDMWSNIARLVTAAIG